MRKNVAARDLHNDCVIRRASKGRAPLTSSDSPLAGGEHICGKLSTLVKRDSRKGTIPKPVSFHLVVC
jgi:hypothetical protein